MGSTVQLGVGEINGEGLGAEAEGEPLCAICLGNTVISTPLSCMHSFCLFCIQTYFRVNYGYEGGRRCPICRGENDQQVLVSVLAQHCDDPRSIQLEEGALEARQLLNAQEEEGDRTPLTITFMPEEDDEGVSRNEWGIDDERDHRRGRYDDEVLTGWADLLGEEPFRPSPESGTRRARRRRSDGRSGSGRGGDGSAGSTHPSTPRG